MFDNREYAFMYRFMISQGATQVWNVYYEQPKKWKKVDFMYSYNPV